MASFVNPYFHSSVTEQGLINRLIIESIQITGKTFFYLPREIQTEDLILGEDVISKFGLAIPIEMYIADSTGFTGDKEMYSKFGLEIRNNYKLVVAKDRWEAEVKSQFDGNMINGEAPFKLVTTLRPQEGDLIYDPLTKFLVEIKFVDHDLEFFELGRNYMYNLSCEAFQYSSETISTGIAAIDAFETRNTLDTLSYQLLCEDNKYLTLEEIDGSGVAEYILQEFIINDEDRKYNTVFKDEGLLLGFSVNDPFNGA